MATRPDDAFKQAFDQFAESETGSDTAPTPPMPDAAPTPLADPPAPVPDAAPALPADPPAPAPDAAPTPPADPSAPALDAAPTPPADLAPTPPADPPTPSADDVLSRLAGMLNAPPAPTPAPTPAPAPQAEAPVYTEEETAQLQAYDKDWPDVSRAESLKRRAEYRDLTKMIYENVVQFVEPLFQLGDQLAQRQHETDLSAKIPDYRTITPQEMTVWIEQQPGYLQAPMKQVMNAGTADEVAHLIGSFRAANQSPAPLMTPTPPAPKAELSDDAKQAAKSLAPVSSDRTVVPAEDDPGDFRTAFDKYAAEKNP